MQFLLVTYLQNLLAAKNLQAQRNFMMVSILCDLLFIRMRFFKPVRLSTSKYLRLNFFTRSRSCVEKLTLEARAQAEQN